MNILDLNLINKAKGLFPRYFEKDQKILELGALDVNGNVREPFAGKFTGVDWTEGKGVDLAVPAKETEFDNEVFDVLLSVNHLEHDPDWQESLGHNFPALKKGALIILRWAGPGSAAHGPEFDPHGEHGYYPKSMAEVLEFLKHNGVETAIEYGDHNPYIGPMMNVIAKKL